MKAQQAQARSSRATIRRTARLSGLLLLCSAPLCFAASNSFSNCDRIARELRSFDVDRDSLSLNGVEHMVVADDRDFEVPADAPILESDAVAPILLLTPRVASILREVFGSDVDSAADEDETAAPSQMAPLAREDNATQLPAELARGIPETPANRYMPRFQRQMYRTDI